MMKKAKEYANDILSNTSDDQSLNQAIQSTFDGMLSEIQELAKQRNIKNNMALKSIIIQQKQKWIAICKIVNKDSLILKEEGFVDLLSLKIPETKYILTL